MLHFYELPRDQNLLDMAVLFPGGHNRIRRNAVAQQQDGPGNGSERVAAARGRVFASA